MIFVDCRNWKEKGSKLIGSGYKLLWSGGSRVFSTGEMGGEMGASPRSQKFGIEVLEVVLYYCPQIRRSTMDFYELWQL